MKRIPLHPFLFGVYPLLALFAANIDQVQRGVTLRPLVFSLLAAALLLLVSWVLLKDLPRAALLSTLALILFFSYGHIYALLKESDFGRHRFLLPVWLLTYAVLAWWVVKHLRNPQKVSYVLNWIGLVALAFPLFQIVVYSMQVNFGREDTSLRLKLNPNFTQGSPPDIYHILLDEYTRADVLQQAYALDNSAFLSQLSALGFTIIDCSQSNYAQTEFVLASMLNLDYLEPLQANLSAGQLSRPFLRRAIMGNAVMHALDDLGYQFVAFETGFPFSEFLTADHYFSPGKKQIDLLSGMNNFEVLFLRSTAGLALLDASRLLPSALLPDVTHPLNQKRERILYDLDKLETIPDEIPGHKYVFAHILLPHEPFVFGLQGEPVDYPETVDEAAYTTAYRDQVLYLNQRLVPILHTILEESEEPPIIILQGDTGPGRVSKDRRMAILNALYLPGGEPTGALSQDFGGTYATFSPVNTYRLIFNRYFGSSLPFLDDISYYSTYDDPFSFEVIPNQSGVCGE